MPIDIVDITFLDSDFSTITTGVDYLNGSIGDKLTAEVTFDIHWETPVDTPMSVSTIGVDRIDRYDGGSFITDGFKNGDDILVSLGANVLEPVTIIGTFQSYLNVSSGLSTVSPPQDGIVYGVTPVQSLDYYYGVVENSVPNSTISLIDGSIQKYKSGAILHTNTTPSSILPDTTINSWVYDLNDQNSTVEGLGALVDVNKQRFKIIHEFYIEPVFRTQDLGVSNNLITPSFLANVKSLKYTLKIDARYTSYGSIVNKSTSNGNIGQFIKTGDVGYFDENGNSGLPDYSLDSISYLEVLNNTSVQSIQPNAETKVSIELDSVSGAFSYTNTKFILHVYRTPNSTSTYENTTTDIKDNFLVSRQSLKINDVPTVSGNGFIKAGATVGMISSSKAVLNFTFLPTFFTSQANVTADLQAFNEDPANVADGYLIFVTCQDKTITNKGLSDKVAVLCDVNRADGIDLDDFYNTDNVCTSTMLFNDHPTNNELLAFTDYKGWLEDSVVAKSNTQVLKTNNNYDIQGNTIQNVWNLNTLTLKIEAEHKTDVTRFFTLEERTFVAGVDEIETRDFILPIGAPQNEIIWSEGFETVTHKQYNLVYPFKIRWEDWKVLFGVDNDFPNGNHDWVRYINTDWDVKVNLYKELDVSQAPESASSPCGLVQFTDANVNFGTNSFCYYIDGVGQDPTTSIIETGWIHTGVLAVSTSQVADKPENGIPFTVCIDAVNASDITVIEFTNFVLVNNHNHPIGVMDFSVLTGLTTFSIAGNSLTNLLMPTTTLPTIRYEFRDIDFDLDLSSSTNLAGILYVQDSLMNNLTLPITTGVFTQITIVNNDNLGQVDFTSLSGDSSNAAISLFGNGWNVTITNQTLVDLDATGWTSTTGFINLLNNSTPTGVGAAAVTSLQGKGWLVITD